MAAQDKGTGKKESVTIKAERGRLSDAEIERMVQVRGSVCCGVAGGEGGCLVMHETVHQAGVKPVGGGRSVFEGSAFSCCVAATQGGQPRRQGGGSPSRQRKADCVMQKLNTWCRCGRY